MTGDLSDWRSCDWPTAHNLNGRYVRLEGLDPDRHGPDLYDASSVPEADRLFTYLYDVPPRSKQDFDIWLAENSRLHDTLFYAVIDLETDRAVGRQALMRIDADNGVIEVGSIYWSPALARTRGATESIYLLARYLFDDLGYRRFEWKCDDANDPSKRAAQRFGFQYEGLFRQHNVVKGRNRDTAWFAMLDSDWKRLAPGYEAWLDPANFTAEGQQIRNLADCIRT